MKKIMFIMTKLGGVGWGGAHKISVMVANYLARNGYEVSFAVSQIDRVDYPIDDKIKVYCLSDLYNHSNIRYVNLIKKLRVFRKLCKDENIDIVVGFTSNMAIYSILATIFSKRKALISERTDPHIEPSKKLLRGIRNVLFCFADGVVFQTPGAQNYYPKMVRKKSVIIPNPVSNTLPSPWIGERKHIIVNFCRIAPQKNLKVLLEAFDIFWSEHQDYRLEIFGDAKEGDLYKKELEEYAKTLSCKENIYFYPACSDVHSKVVSAMAFASSSDYEGISNSMLESLAMGLPVIVTDCENGGERMCIEDGVNGFIVPRKNPVELALAMDRLVKNEMLIRDISSNAIKIKERFSDSIILKSWKKIVDSMI